MIVTYVCVEGASIAHQDKNAMLTTQHLLVHVWEERYTTFAVQYNNNKILLHVIIGFEMEI